MPSKIRKGDLVEVITGKGRAKKGEPGFRGTVTEVIPDSKMVIVEGYNLVTRHLRQHKNKSGQVEGGKTQMPAAIAASRVALIDPSTNKPTRVGFRQEADGTKVRVAKTRKTGTVLGKG